MPVTDDAMYPWTPKLAMWPKPYYSCGLGHLVDRRYAEDILRRELENLEYRLRTELDQIHHYAYGCWDTRDSYCQQLEDQAYRRHQRDKEHLYRQFDTYNQPYRDYIDHNLLNAQLDILKYSINPPIYLEKKNMYYNNAWNWSYDVKPSKQFIIIGSSGAAAKPVVHSTLGSAEAEANRLAKKNPGEEFTIYATVKSYKVEEKPVTVKVYA